MFRLTHSRSNLIMTAVVLSLLVFILGRDAFLARRIRYELGGEAIVVTYPRISLLYREITSLTFYREPPPLKSSFFSSIGRGRVGRFYLAGHGWVQVSSPDYEKRPLLVVEAGDRLYGLSPREGEEFYQELLSRLPAKRGGGESMRAAP